MLAAFFACVFFYSLLPGRTEACLAVARRQLRGVLPLGAEIYSRRLTWLWAFVLTLLAAVGFITWTLPLSGLAHAAIGAGEFAFWCLFYYAETRIRHRVYDRTFFTSGSTASPKRIVKDFKSLALEVAYHRDTYLKPDGSWNLAGVAPGERVTFLSTIDPVHMYGTLWIDLLPRALGAACDREIIRSPESLVAKMQAADKVFLVTTPSFLSRFTAYAALYDVPRNCVEIVTSGAMLEKDVSDRARAVFGIEPRQIFGSTETGGVASRRGDGEWRVFDPVKVESGEDGRLLVRSAFSISRRYLMGDAAEFTDSSRRAFILRGRTDRLVKINEERVDLAAAEKAVCDLGFADCALAKLDTPRGPILGALLVPTIGQSVNRSIGQFSTLDLRKLLAPAFPKGAAPRRIRIVTALPRNAQGKVTGAAVRRELESALTEPRCFGETEAEGRYVFEGEYAASAPCFQGHFPDLPILPGVAQLGLVTRFAARLSGDAGRTLKGVKKMKFMHLVRPGDRIRIEIAALGEDRFSYSIAKGEDLCSSGVLQF